MSDMNMQNFSRTLAAWILCWTLMAPPSSAQQLPVVVKPNGPIVARSYMGTAVAPVFLHNSSRIRALLRSGNLYLTVQDALALAIENNLNLEVERYSLPTADWSVERNEAGGPIRGLSGSTANVGAVNAGTGVLGAIQSAGVNSGGGGGGGFVGGGGGANIQQIGPVVVKFDPAFTGSTTFSHLTYPQSNLSVSEVPALVDSNRINTQTLSQGLASGGTFQFTNYAYSQRENAPSDILNPVSTPYMRAYFQQPLLQSYGAELNTRSIRVARNGVVVARETYRSNLINLINTILGQYWGLVTANEELRARQRALENARKFRDDTEREINAGALPRVQMPRAEAEVAGRAQDVTLAQVALRQQENSLKEQLVRELDPAIEAAPIVPLDAIQVPERDDLPPMRDLVAVAMKNRPDVAISKLQDENAAINALGTRNGLLPTAIAYGTLQDRGSAGTAHVTPGGSPDPYFVGGYGTSLGQILRHNFPTESGGIYFQIPINNRVAQADYGIEQMQMQSSQLTSQRANNDIVVSISNQLVALQQARVRYNAALNTRKLQEQLLAAEQEKFAYGTVTFSALIIDQRNLVNAQISEVNALNAYARAHDGLDQVLGGTLERYNITLDEGIQGRINRESRIPDVIEQQTKNQPTKNR
jgi:outer membrane protein